MKQKAFFITLLINLALCLTPVIISHTNSRETVFIESDEEIMPLDDGEYDYNS